MSDPAPIILHALLTVLLEHDGYTRVPGASDEIKIGGGLMRGLELALRHPEYAAALHLAYARWTVRPNDGLLDDFVRTFPISRWGPAPTRDDEGAG